MGGLSLSIHAPKSEETPPNPPADSVTDTKRTLDKTVTTPAQDAPAKPAAAQSGASSKPSPAASALPLRGLPESCPKVVLPEAHPEAADTESLEPGLPPPGPPEPILSQPKDVCLEPSRAPPAVSMPLPIVSSVPTMPPPNNGAESGAVGIVDISATSRLTNPTPTGMTPSTAPSGIEHRSNRLAGIPPSALITAPAPTFNTAASTFQRAPPPNLNAVPPAFYPAPQPQAALQQALEAQIANCAELRAQLQTVTSQHNALRAKWLKDVEQMGIMAAEMERMTLDLDTARRMNILWKQKDGASRTQWQGDLEQWQADQERLRTMEAEMGNVTEQLKAVQKDRDFQKQKLEISRLAARREGRGESSGKVGSSEAAAVSSAVEGL